MISNSYIILFFFWRQIPISAVVSFVEALEVGYSKHKNPYHNLIHAADVTQTVHYLLLKTGMVVSRIHTNLRLRLFYQISLHQHKQVEWCDGVPKDVFNVLKFIL